VRRLLTVAALAAFLGGVAAPAAALTLNASVTEVVAGDSIKVVSRGFESLSA
jgi:hypothetical protein